MALRASAFVLALTAGLTTAAEAYWACVYAITTCSTTVWCTEYYEDDTPTGREIEYQDWGCS